MKGWVYIITNKSMPELLKVGFSTKDPELRAEELHTTGVPHRYVVEYDVLVNDPRKVEQKAHALLKQYHENKEWFRCDISTAIIAIREAANTSIILESSREEIEQKIKDAWLDELIAWADENGISDYFDDLEVSGNEHDILAMTDLDLSNNELTELPEFIGKLGNLTRLDLSNNELTELPESIGKLGNLTLLDLSNNELTELPESIGNLSNLTNLYLSDNKLIKPPKSIDNLIQLTNLNLSDNKLTIIPESINNLKNLTALHLENNKLTKLPETIGNLNNLETLSLLGNNLTELPESICKLTKLKLLNLSGNPIKYLPFDLSHLSFSLITDFDYQQVIEGKGIKISN